MKFLFDFFPILLFFIAYKLLGIYPATAVAIAASLIQVVAYRLKTGRFETMHLLTLVLIAGLGGATLYLQDEMFIKWKPTVVNWLFGLAFLGSHFLRGDPLTRRMMGSAITLPDVIWRRLNMGWALFFIATGFLNLYVVYHFDTDTWVNFKLFGLMGLTLAFIIAQAIYLSRYMEPEKPEKAEEAEEEE